MPSWDEQTIHDEEAERLLNATLAAAVLPASELELAPLALAFQALRQRIEQLPAPAPATALSVNRLVRMPGRTDRTAAYSAFCQSWWTGVSHGE